MGSLTMDMSSFAVERGEVAEVEYGAEVLYSGWNPALSQQAGITEHVSMPNFMANLDIDAFLKRVYASQR